jgi:hypothetical protein
MSVPVAAQYPFDLTPVVVAMMVRGFRVVVVVATMESIHALLARRGTSLRVKYLRVQLTDGHPCG